MCPCGTVYPSDDRFKIYILTTKKKYPTFHLTRTFRLTVINNQLFHTLCPTITSSFIISTSLTSPFKLSVIIH